MTTKRLNGKGRGFFSPDPDPGRPCSRDLSPRLQIGSESAGLDVVGLTDRESMRLVRDRMVRDAEAF